MARGVVMKRFFKHLYQRLTRGWDDRELWSLDHTFAAWIVPRLERLKEMKRGVPASCLPEPSGPYTDEEYSMAELAWEYALDEMIEGFKVKQQEWDEGGWAFDAPPEQYTRAKELFIKHLDDLWD
jgi:hypothetical protein